MIEYVPSPLPCSAPAVPVAPTVVPSDIIPPPVVPRPVTPVDTVTAAPANAPAVPLFTLTKPPAPAISNITHSSCDVAWDVASEAVAAGAAVTVEYAVQPSSLWSLFGISWTVAPSPTSPDAQASPYVLLSLAPATQYVVRIAVSLPGQPPVYSDATAPFTTLPEPAPTITPLPKITTAPSKPQCAQRRATSLSWHWAPAELPADTLDLSRYKIAYRVEYAQSSLFAALRWAIGISERVCDAGVCRCRICCVPVAALGVWCPLSSATHCSP